MDSDDETELESEAAEMLAFETATLAAMRAGDPELAVQYVDGTLRCPLCSPSRRKQSYAYQDLLQHATAVAAGNRGPEVAGRHRALRLFLESDLVELAPPPPVERARRNQELEMFPRRTATAEKLVCPWSVVVYQSISDGNRNGDQEGRTFAGKSEIVRYFAEFRPDKVQVVWDTRGHLGLSILQFGRGFEGLNDSLALENCFMDESRGRRDYERNLATGNLGQGFYGWLAREEDLSGRAGSEGAAVRKYLNSYGDLKDVAMLGAEVKKIHDLQLTKLAESLAEKDKEIMNLKNELEVMERRAAADKLASLKLGAWTGCQIL